MAFNNGGTHRPEKKGFIIALVKAINENKTELGTKPAPRPKRK